MPLAGNQAFGPCAWYHSARKPLTYAMLSGEERKSTSISATTIASLILLNLVAYSAKEKMVSASGRQKRMVVCLLVIFVLMSLSPVNIARVRECESIEDIRLPSNNSQRRYDLNIVLTQRSPDEKSRSTRIQTPQPAAHRPPPMDTKAAMTARLSAYDPSIRVGLSDFL